MALHLPLRLFPGSLTQYRLHAVWVRLNSTKVDSCNPAENIHWVRQRIFFIRVEWPIADKGSQINRYLNIVCKYNYFISIEGSLEVKLPTTWADGKAEVGRVREEKKKEDERRERVRGKKVQVHEKVEIAKHCVSPMICGSGGLKSRLAKVRSHLARWEMKNCRCGGKHISKSKCAKHTILGALLEVEMLKNCTPLWREANFEVKSAKNWRVLYGHFWTFRCPFAWQAQGIVCTLKKVSKKWRIFSVSKNDLQAWDIWRGSVKVHFAWQAQYKRHVHQRCSEARAEI